MPYLLFSLALLAGGDAFAAPSSPARAGATPTVAPAVAAAPARHWSRAEYAGLLTDPELAEVSGLAASRAHPGVYWAHNDGDNSERLVALRADGSRVASVRVEGVRNIDWEDIDSFDLGGKHYLLVADTGDNGGIRKVLQLHVFEEPATLRDGATVKPAWSIEFRWPDGARDCEASAVDVASGQVLLVSKKRVPPELFAVPLRPPAGDAPVVAQAVGVLHGIAQPSTQDLKQNPVYGRYRSQISGADLSPNGRVLAILNYHSVYLYVRKPGQAWGEALKDGAAPDELALPWLPQAEGIAFAPNGSSLLVGGEQLPSPLIRFRVLP
jgi:hypothetical protein